jgi:hypothetical protein
LKRSSRLTVGLEERGAAKLERVRGEFLQLRQRLFRIAARPARAMPQARPPAGTSDGQLPASLKLARLLIDTTQAGYDAITLGVVATFVRRQQRLNSLLLAVLGRHE